ncbi:hypothetical protein [Flagellimonas meridianipacifica]|uniref:Uncharacterized protein n=1 Tax=Flagellimonas meridianipacifica TaxID=1080225 RepID=A0A2T0MBG2_9FLAO|nr:hypothetical protein [Allomuricauda pacifica]PRX54836.1 hypothetical protein CLV81_3240 [Allomuricauda pacifica]
MRAIENVLRTVRTESPILYWIGMFHFVLAAICLFGWMIDDRMLTGLNVWVKPLKFTISGGLYVLTSGYLITLYPFSRRKKNIVNNIISWTMLIEIGIIVFQAARGVRSHYNGDSWFDARLFMAMGVLISIIVCTMIFFVVETIRLRLRTERHVQWAILLGWLVVLFGSWAGGQMIGQMSHNVGVADGGEGLPLLNWSTIAGDLRIAHFFGLHGIQIIPLFAVVLTNKWKASNITKSIVVILFGLLYASWIAFTFYQAKQGIPLVRV